MRDAGGERLREQQRFLAAAMPLRVERTRPRRPRPAEPEILVQLAAKGCNHTASGLQLPTRNCTRLHQIAPNCGHCAKKSKRRKPERKKSILPLFIGPIFLPAQWQRRSAS